MWYKHFLKLVTDAAIKSEWDNEMFLLIVIIFLLWWSKSKCGCPDDLETTGRHTIRFGFNCNMSDEFHCNSSICHIVIWRFLELNRSLSGKRWQFRCDSEIHHTILWQILENDDECPLLPITLVNLCLMHACNAPGLVYTFTLLPASNKCPQLHQQQLLLWHPSPHACH